MDNRHTFFICGSPESISSQIAYQTAVSLIENGQRIILVFFFDAGVLHAKVNPSGESTLASHWNRLSTTHDFPLICCATSCLHHGIESHLQPGFKTGTLTQCIESILASDEIHSSGPAPIIKRMDNKTLAFHYQYAPSANTQECHDFDICLAATSLGLTVQLHFSGDGITHLVKNTPSAKILSAVSFYGIEDIMVDAKTLAENPELCDKLIDFKSTDRFHVPTDPQGYLLDHREWSPELAEQIAKQEGIVLTKAHWAVISFLQAFYQQHQHIPPMRPLVTAMREYFPAEQCNSRYLYQLFPKGPGLQASKIAGLPKPKHCI